MKQSPQDFFDTYSGVAVNDYMFSGIPPSIKLAQAALESSWGGSGLTINANNYFGIKSHSWGGATYDARTKEFYGSGGPTIVDAEWRFYGSPYESFMDHSKFLDMHDRYDFLYNLDPLDYRGWSHGLENASYATDPDYAEKLIYLIEKYNLSKYDRRAVNLKALKTAAWILFGLSVLLVVFLLIKKFR